MRLIFFLLSNMYPRLACGNNVEGLYMGLCKSYSIMLVQCNEAAFTTEVVVVLLVIR